MSGIPGTLPEVHYAVELASGDASPWQVVGVDVREGLSSLYEGTLELSAEGVAGLVGQELVVTWERGAVARRLCGIVRAVDSVGSTASRQILRASLVPRIWFLSQRVQSRIYQDVDAIEIVLEVLKDAGLYQGDGQAVLRLERDQHPKREYCVQYQESDLNFVLRLLEEEGVSFYFEHAGSCESLVLHDGALTNVYPTVSTHPGGVVEILEGGLATTAWESVHRLEAHESLQPTGVVTRDFDFTNPDATESYTLTAQGGAGGREVYEYPARYTFHAYDEGRRAYDRHSGARAARVRMESLQARRLIADGTSNVAAFAPGMTFTLRGHGRSDLDRTWLITKTVHTGHAPEALGHDTGETSQSRYENVFECIPLETPFRPPIHRRGPVIQGAQTAMVVAEPGSSEEICVDPHGRILVRFHWDRPERRAGVQQGKRASCWIRVAQFASGGGWGMMSIPRVGTEVLVTFLEGDPDHPLVTGCLFNGRQRPPLDLPAEKTRTTFRSNSSPGGSGFNELTFEDLARNERVYLHAQKDHAVVVRNDQAITVGRNRTEAVGGRERVTVTGDRIVLVRTNDSLEVEGNHDIEVHGDTGQTIHVDATCTIVADGKIVLQCGGSSIVMTPDAITLKSATVRSEGATANVIKGGVVKVNCDD